MEMNGAKLRDHTDMVPVQGRVSAVTCRTMLYLSDPESREALLEEE
jgi:hypothetical protein